MDTPPVPPPGRLQAYHHGQKKSAKPRSTKRGRGRTETRTIKLDATPERAARALFSAVKAPDPSARIPKRRRMERPKA